MSTDKEAQRQAQKDAANMRITLIVSELATCGRHRVGSVVMRDDRILATGRNGTGPGMPHCCDLLASGELKYEQHHEWSKIHEIHAEINALRFCAKYGLSTEEATIYVTHSPCAACAEAIISSGIKRVVYIERYDGSEEIESRFSERGIEVKRFDASLKELRRREGTSSELFGIDPGREGGDHTSKVVVVMNRDDAGALTMEYENYQPDSSESSGLKTRILSSLRDAVPVTKDNCPEWAKNVMTESQKARILELDPEATFEADGRFHTYLDYETLNDIFNNH